MEKPDYHIEMFWLDFKKSMFNYYKNKDSSRPIDTWSETLNEFQKNENYNIIEKYIKNYITLYGIDLLKSRNVYHLEILKSNIKRWDKIIKLYNMSDDEKYYYNIIYFLIDIFTNLRKNLPSNLFDTFYQEIELFIIYKDYSKLIKYCIDYEMGFVLDKLNKYIDINKIIKDIYTIDLPEKISGDKIIKIIKNNISIYI